MINTNLEEFKQERLEYYCRIYGEQASGRKEYIGRRAYYYVNIRQIIEDMILPGARVLCLASDIGQYLEWAKPCFGVGVEQCPELVAEARRLHPSFQFHCQRFEDVDVQGQFDYILIVNGLNDFFDVQEVMRRLRNNCWAHTRVVVVGYNFLWQPLAALAQRLGFKRPQPPQNWLSPAIIANIFFLAGYKEIRKSSRLLWPFKTVLLSFLANRIVAALPFMHHLCLIQTMAFRFMEQTAETVPTPSVSVIVPCRNECENIELAVKRMTRMVDDMEIIFCDDQSTDGTGERIRKVMTMYPEWDIKLVHGPGLCKAENVWAGFDAATKDVLMILDGDLAVAPEELPKFYEALTCGKGEFVNGTRMIYPMRNQAMRLLNLFGNKIFSLLFSYILNERITDTLCGTKVLWRRDYLRLCQFKGSWGIADRWGDYELIFGAAKLLLDYVEVPVHYLDRTYGVTKMNKRFSNAWRMLQMCNQAFKYFRLKYSKTKNLHFNSKDHL